MGRKRHASRRPLPRERSIRRTRGDIARARSRPSAPRRAGPSSQTVKRRGVSADSLGPPRVVVIGAGFAGMAVVRALRDSDAHVYPFAMSQRKNAKTCLARSSAEPARWRRRPSGGAVISMYTSSRPVCSSAAYCGSVSSASLSSCCRQSMRNIAVVRARFQRSKDPLGIQEPARARVPLLQTDAGLDHGSASPSRGSRSLDVVDRGGHAENNDTDRRTARLDPRSRRDPRRHVASVRPRSPGRDGVPQPVPQLRYRLLPRPPTPKPPYAESSTRSPPSI
jgi:hypothetical protein